MSATSTFGSTTGGDLLANASMPLLGLLLLWSRDEPGRVGEVSLVPPLAPGAIATLGRSAPEPGSGPPAMEWMRLRPGHAVPTGPLTSPRISRTQLHVQVAGPRTLQLTNVGRCALMAGEREVQSTVLGLGDIVELRKAALFLCIERRISLPMPDPPVVLHPFGEADAHGLVGESPTAWELRARIAFVAGRDAHVLIRGPSGTGKELVAQALHRLSGRGRKPMVSRNAATFPETLIDAELFGNARGFPNAGMPERPGLIGEADGSTLFLDEFAELPSALQAHLLRVLDDGEHTRLGESRPRHSDFRLIAATNRPEGALKHDVLARLPLRLEVPGLDQRREDIPLLARHLLRRVARNDAAMARRYFQDGDLSNAPRMTAGLVSRLVQHPYATHVRELEALLWRAIADGSGNTLDFLPAAAPSAAERASDAGPEPVVALAPSVDPLSIPPEVIQACLDRHDGRQEPAWRELGLSSRHVLTRLVRRYDLKVRSRG